jgi:hypothetical protein
MIDTEFLPMEQLTNDLKQSKIVKFCEFASKRFANIHLKELAVSAVGPQREMRVAGQELVNFGFRVTRGCVEHFRDSVVSDEGGSSKPPWAVCDESARRPTSSVESLRVPLPAGS